MTTKRHLVIGTAGHIDHGKTALVRALTGINTDRLAEEKRRGITIELGFAPWQLADEIEASIVDVPGHERLVRTMVAGAGGMDIALLVVAADDGVMPQTREHLDVLRLLGVPAGMVVLTKCDLVDEELLALVEEDVREAVRGSIFESAQISQTSSKDRTGLEELTARVLKLANNTATRPSHGPTFLPLDRLFTKAGYGTVGTGTTLRGSLKVGDALEAHGELAEPIGGLKVRGLQALGAARDEVSAGMRAAVNLTGRNVERVSRGMVLTHAGSFRSVDSAVVWARVLPHAEPLGQETVAAHLGTSEREATVLPLGTQSIEPGQEGGLLLRFSRPIATYAGQRMVLRRPGLHGQATVAGGEVLDPEPPRGKGSVSLAASQLDRLRSNAQDRLLAIARESRARGIDEASILRRLPPGEGDNAIRKLEKKGKLVRVPGAEPRWLDADLAAGLVRRVIAMVNGLHDKEPLAPGLIEAEVTSRLPPPERHLAALATHLAVGQNKLLRDGAHLAVPGRGAAVDENAKREMDAIVSLYTGAGVTPPSDKEVGEQLGLETKRLQELLGLLRRRNALKRVTETLHFAADTIDTIEGRVLDKLQDQELMSAPEFKELAGGVSRKWAIPLLEYFDRNKVTLRVGDVRKLHPSRKTTT
jgi:selenocysteine-specific elongation factor